MREEAFVRSVAAWSTRHPRRVLVAAALLVLVALGLAATRLELRTSNLDLVDPTLPEVSRFLQFAEEFGTPNVLAVVLEGDDIAALENAVRELGPRFRTLHGVSSVIDRLPLDEATREAFGADEFMRSADKRLCCIFIQPEDARSRTDAIDPIIQDVRRILADAQLHDAGVRAGLTGLPAYAIDDRDVIQRDISRLSFISLVLIVGLFASSFRAVRRPAMAMTSLTTGVILTIGFAALYPGHLTLLSAFFASILFGLCDDLGIQTVSRIEELVAEGMPEEDAIPAALGALGRAMVTGTLTTALAFYSMAWSGFRGFAELGIIAGTGSLLCMLATITLLPALLSLWRSRAPRASIHADRFYGSILAHARHPVWATMVAVVGVVAAILPAPAFDTDYLNLEPKGSEAVRLEREMVKRTSFSTQFAVFVTDDLMRAHEIAEKLLDEDCVGEVRSIADIEAIAPGGDLSAIPPSYVAALQSPRGRYAVYAYPQGDVWAERPQAEFIARMRAIDPNVTGMPFLGSFMVGQSIHGMKAAALFAGLSLIACVFIDFRRLLPFALAILPTAMSIVSIRGFMSLLGLSFNPLNVMAIPVIIGLAVNYGVHLVHRFREEGGDVEKTVRGTGRSILLSALTTLIGFGALMFSQHRGLASFAQVMTIGLSAALLYSVAVLPTLLVRLKARLL